MLEFLASTLQGKARILDLGSGSGSFLESFKRHPVVHIDIDPGRLPSKPAQAVCADAASLPFRSASFALIISNHSLEHIAQLEPALAELDRVLDEQGSIFVTVPDASTLSDKLYRWLAQGGGHVNPFVDLEDLIRMLQARTRSRCVFKKILHSGFSFLNRRTTDKLPRRAWLLGGGFELPLAICTFGFRLIDRFLGTRLSVYGWCLILTRGNVSEPPIDMQRVITNVCIRCGAGHSHHSLNEHLNRFLLFDYYHCPFCSALNLATKDQ